MLEKESDMPPPSETKNGEDKNASDVDPWPEHFDASLTPFLSKDAINQLKQMWLEGPEPPRVSDSGWAGRNAKGATEGDAGGDAVIALEKEQESSKGSRGGRGGRGRRAGKPNGGKGREDYRKVLTEVIEVYSLVQLLAQQILCLGNQFEGNAHVLSQDCSPTFQRTP
jgi:tRNA pseudouridine13 synthase